MVHVVDAILSVHVHRSTSAACTSSMCRKDNPLKSNTLLVRPAFFRSILSLPLFKWADIDVAPRSHVEKGVKGDRRQIANNCFALAMKVDHYSAAHPAEEPVQVVFNFEEDVEEMKIAKGIEDDDTAKCFFHRAEAASRAISERCSGVSACARAGPPLVPAFRARISVEDAVVFTSPLATSTMNLASWFGSRGRLGARVINWSYIHKHRRDEALLLPLPLWSGH